MTPHSHHNTTRLRGEPLAGAERQAVKQDELVRRFFERNAGRLYTPSEVHRLLEKPLRGAPLTSVRRAITNLERRRLLTKTDTQRTGPYERPESCWTYRTEERPVQTEMF